MAVRYLQKVAARRRDIGDDIQRGLQSGEQVGKLLGSLGSAIQGAQKNALANKLMNQQSISEQPGAGQTIDLGKLPGEGSGGDGSGTPQDLGTLPADATFSNPATGNIEPLQGQGSDDDLSQAIAASRLQSSLSAPTVGSVPDINQAVATARLKQPGDFTLNPSDYSGGSGRGTVGGLVHTGGVAEMDLQKEMLAQQIQKAQLAKANAPAAPPDPLDQALKRVRLAQAQQNLLNPKGNKPAVVKPEDMPITNLDSEPVDNQGQLNKHIDTQYGKGAANGIASTIMEPDQIEDPKNPGTMIPNPNAPVITKDENGLPSTVTVGPKNKRITMPIKTAQTLVKQQNSLNFKQNQPLLRVPGETDLNRGLTKDNPYPVNSKLDMVSRAHGTWVKLPGGQIAQVP